MAETTHAYETHIEWTSTLKGTLTAADRPPILAGAPPEFGGTADVWSPEHLCVAAVNACVMLTFAAIAHNSKVPFRSYTASAVGALERIDERGPVFTRIVVKPRIVIGPEVDRSRVERLVAMAEKRCFVSNSLTATVTLEPQIITAA